jgi:methionyl-tRNA formyltransferase
MYKRELLNICHVVGIHESLLPKCAGAVPLANAILRDEAETGITLFQLDEGVDTGPLIGQLKCTMSPRKYNATEIYNEMMELEKELIRTFVPWLRRGIAPRIPQDMTKRTVYGKVKWEDWPEDWVRRARVYPYK